jgi:hypothetical protein
MKWAGAGASLDRLARLPARGCGDSLPRLESLRLDLLALGGRSFLELRLDKAW